MTLAISLVLYNGGNRTQFGAVISCPCHKGFRLEKLGGWSHVGMLCLLKFNNRMMFAFY